MAEAALATADTGVDMGSATAALRKTMVERQIRTFDVTNIPLLQRFQDVPREIFLPEDLAALAYSDRALVLRDERGRRLRHLLPPLILARFIQEAEIRESDKVLDVAAGTGYSAAILAGLAREVVALESHPELAAKMKANLQALGIGNVRVETGPLERGVPQAAPFDVILVQGGVEDHLDRLLDLLTENGHLLAIAKTDESSGQCVMRFERSAGKPAGFRGLFDASAPILEGFEKAPAFVF